MNKMISLGIAVLMCANLMAQEDTNKVRKVSEKLITKEFPNARVFNLEYTHSFSRDFKSRLYKEDFQEGNIQDQKNVHLLINMPLYKTQKWTFTGTLHYNFNEFVFKDLDNISTSSMYQQNDIMNYHYFSTALSATYFSYLFKKPLIYNASVIVDGNEKGLERVKGLVGASLLLKRNARTTMTVGMAVIIDPTSQIPFFPTFSYYHRFKNSNWEFDFILPQRLMFRHPLTERGRISIGSEFGSNGFYVNVDAPNFPSVLEYSQLEIRTGLMYEHKITNNFIITAKGGLLNFISNRMTERGEDTKDYIYDNTQDPTGYFNVGISYNPFGKKSKAKKN